MTHVVAHPLEPTKARELLDQALETYRANYADHAVNTCWVDERTAMVDFEFTGNKIGASITVCDHCYDIDLKLPLMLQPFRGRIAESLETELQRWIERA